MRRPGRLRFALASIALPALLLAACGDDDDDGGNTPETTSSPSATASAVASPPATATDDAYPVTVTDLLDRSVEIPSKPQKIVALSPTAVEFVYAVGGEVVGRADSADYPPEAQSAEPVGNAYTPNFETIIGLDPDLIVADSIIHAQPQFRSAIEQLNVPTIFAGATSYDDVVEGITVLGEALDAEALASDVLAAIDEQMKDAKAMVEGQDVSAMVIIADRDQVIYAANGNSYVGDLMAELGINNPFGDEPDAGPQPGFTTAPPELILQSDPGYLLTLSPAPPPAPPLSQVITMVPGLGALTAAQEGRISEIDVDLMLQASGPRAGEAMIALAEAVTAAE